MYNNRKVGAAIPKVSSDALIFPEVLRVFVALPSQEDGFLYSATPRKSKKDESSDDSSSGTSASCELGRNSGRTKSWSNDGLAVV